MFMSGSKVFCRLRRNRNNIDAPRVTDMTIKINAHKKLLRNKNITRNTKNENE